MNRHYFNTYLLVAALIIFVFPARTDAAQVRRVVLVSIDGLRPDAVTPEWTPTLIRLMEQGASTLQAQCLKPPRTIPNHISLLTGLTPRTHGFKQNLYPDDVFASGTILELAREAGYTTALYISKGKLRILAKPETYDRLIVTDRGLSEDAVNEFLADFALPESRWDLSVVHLEEPNWMGHQYGWMSQLYITATFVADFRVGQIVRALTKLGLFSQTLLIVISDHGGKGFHHKHPTPEAMTIPWIAVGPNVPKGLTITQPIELHYTAPTILAALGIPVPPTMEGSIIKAVAGKTASVSK